MSVATAWYRWWEGDCEVHIVPEVERRRHRPLECWCDPTLDLMEDGVLRVTHRLQFVNNGLERVTP